MRIHMCFQPNLIAALKSPQKLEDHNSVGKNIKECSVNKLDKKTFPNKLYKRELYFETCSFLVKALFCSNFHPILHKKVC